MTDTFKPLLEKPEYLDEQFPDVSDAWDAVNPLVEMWKASNHLKHRAQCKWISNIKMALNKMIQASRDPALNKGLHELIISIIFNLISSPKALLHNYPCMALLGSVSKKLQKYTGWHQGLYRTIVESNCRKNTGAFINNEVLYKVSFILYLLYKVKIVLPNDLF